jgi:hypothetical protein
MSGNPSSTMTGSVRYTHHLRTLRRTDFHFTLGGEGGGGGEGEGESKTRSRAYSAEAVQA